PRGITLFEGDIGSGKSTILMGIEFALFGLGSQKPEALLSKKANYGSVILNFESGGQKCEVKRTLKRKGDTVSQDPKHTHLKINDEEEPLSPTELKQRVLQILNFNEPGDPRSESRIYRYAIFTPQEEMKQILYESSKRLETIRKAFGVEDYKIAVENSKEILRFLHERVGIFKERFKDMDKHELDLKNSNENISKAEGITNEIQKQEKELQEKKSIVLENIESIREKQQEQRELETNRKNIENQIAEKVIEQKKISNQIKQTLEEIEESEKELHVQKRIVKPTSKSIEEINQKIKEFTELKNTIGNLEYRKVTLADDIKKLETRLKEYKGSTTSELNTQLEKIKEERLNYQEKYEDLQKELKEIQRKEARLEAEKKVKEDGIRKISELGSKCPHCEHPLTSEHKQKVWEQYNQELSAIKEEIEKISKKQKELESQNAKLEQVIFEADSKIKTIQSTLPDLENLLTKTKELNENENNLKEIRSKNVVSEKEDLPESTTYEEPVEYFTNLKEAIQRYQNAEVRISDIEKNIAKLTRSKKQYEEDTDTKSSQIKQLEDELIKTSSKLKTLQSIDNQYAELKNEENNLNSEINKLAITISINKEKIENERKNIAKLEQEISKAQKWRDVHKKYSNYHNWLNEFFIPAVDRIEKQVLLSIQQNFNETYHRWYSILIDDPTKESRIDENFTPIIEQDGYEQDITFLSGGEKTSVALAYRLTLNSLMRQESESMKSNLLILDEPTDGFSKTQLAKVKTLLSELKSQQIILVSHEKELETYVDNIFHINKSSGISKVTRLAN
ncbi:MAG TPA: SMC family ATPase, partial [Candidatus Nitrosotalea sp.]|nr:SMC family ATPase [Candidatus Nitrosotalea sp.]